MPARARNSKTASRVREAAMRSDAVSLLELVNAAAGIDELLTTRKEGVTLAANIHLHDFHVFRGTRLERLAASADDRHLVVIGMNFGLHDFLTSLVFLGNSLLLYPFWRRSSTDFGRQTEKLIPPRNFFAFAGRRANHARNACKKRTTGV